MRLLVALATLAAVLAATWASRAEARPAPSVTARAQGDGAALVARLRRGGAVIVFRHAATDWSQSDADPVDLSRCSAQRNLSRAGRADARAIGAAFRRLRLPVGTVASSPFCRTRQTARLAFGRTTVSSDLLSSLARPDAEEDLRQRFRRRLRTPPRAGTNTVLVSHAIAITSATGTSLAEGEAAVFARVGDGRGFRLIARATPRRWSALAAALATARRVAAAPVVQEYRLPAGSGPHDVAPAADGTVWYTAQAAGELGRLDPRTGRVRRVPLGEGSSPHGVIVGPDRAAWVTDSGLNAIVRVDAETHAVRRFPLPDDRAGANLNTATFDRNGTLWFTGQDGVYGRLEPAGGAMRVFDAPRGPGPYGISTTRSGQVWYSSLAGSHIARIDPRTGKARLFSPPRRGVGARRVWPDSRGRLWVSYWNAARVGMYDPRTRRWREWRLPGRAPMPYAVYVDDRDRVWLTDFAASTIVRFDPRSGRFRSFRLRPQANVRQLLGRRGEVWGAESGADRLVVIRTP